MWVVPDEAGIDPGYEQLEIDDELLKGGLVPVASGMDAHRDAAAIRIANKYAALYAARLAPGQSVELPEAPYVHLFVAEGDVALEGAGGLDDRGRRPHQRERRSEGDRDGAAARCWSGRCTPACRWPDPLPR